MSYAFMPVSSCSDYLVQDSDYELSCEHRLRRKHASLYEKLKSKQSSIIHRLSDGYSQLRSFYRLLSNPRLQMSDLINKHCQISSTHLKGRHVLAIGDGVSINLSAAYGRMNEVEQLKVGVLENNQTQGLMAQVILAIDAQNSEVLGLGDIVLYNRKKRQSDHDKRKYRQLSYEEKESSKWTISALNAKVHLQGCESLTYVYDRDADRFEVLEKLCAIEGTDFVIRLRENRLVQSGQQEARLDQLMAQKEVQGRYQLKIRPLNHLVRQGRARKYRKGRTSTMEVRWLAVDQIKVPSELLRKEKSRSPIHRPTYFIEVKEADNCVPQGQEAVHWKLLTTHPVTNMEQSLQIIAYYQQRWHVEQLFRVCKKKGLQLESTQLGSIEAIMKLSVMSFAAACQLMQINLSRGKEESKSIHFVFNEQEQRILSKLNGTLSGSTKLLQNPYPKDQLSWARWIIGRLGGWKGYLSQGPPGPITISRGFEKLQIYFQAWMVFNSE